jgi:hypothetical protein
LAALVRGFETSVREIRAGEGFPTVRIKSGAFGSAIAEAALGLPSQTLYTNFDPTNSTLRKLYEEHVAHPRAEWAMKSAL